jgi:hypothetical protein
VLSQLMPPITPIIRIRLPFSFPAELAAGQD